MDCSSFPKCSAPLCPRNKDTLKDGVWFPDDEICTQSNPVWVKVQKKIKAKARDTSTGYTYKMLSRNCRIGKAIKGIDPEKDIYIEEQKWLLKHPAKKEVSEEQKEVLRRRALKMRAGSASKSRRIRKKTAIY